MIDMKTSKKKRIDMAIIKTCIINIVNNGGDIIDTITIITSMNTKINQNKIDMLNLNFNIITINMIHK